MSNGLPDPDSLLTPGGRPVDAANGVLNGLNDAANGFNGPEFIFFPMMATANDRLRAIKCQFILSCTHIRSLLIQRTMNVDLCASLKFHPSLHPQLFYTSQFPIASPNWGSQ